jgi:hypothetical protein
VLGTLGIVRWHADRIFAHIEPRRVHLLTAADHSRPGVEFCMIDVSAAAAGPRGFGTPRQPAPRGLWRDCDLLDYRRCPECQRLAVVDDALHEQMHESRFWPLEGKLHARYERDLLADMADRIADRRSDGPVDWRQMWEDSNVAVLARLIESQKEAFFERVVSPQRMDEYAGTLKAAGLRRADHPLHAAAGREWYEAAAFIVWTAVMHHGYWYPYLTFYEQERPLIRKGEAPARPINVKLVSYLQRSCFDEFAALQIARLGASDPAVLPASFVDKYLAGTFMPLAQRELEKDRNRRQHPAV